jgi:hypothetical protein
MEKSVIEKETWICTDEDTNQFRMDIGDNIFRFKEERVIQPDTNEKEVFDAVIDLKDYTQIEMFESVRSFGYSFNEMAEWIDQGENLSLIAECIFEMLD